MVAAGGQGDVLFWDRRMQKQLEKFDDMHMDDVTQVRRLGPLFVQHHPSSMLGHSGQ